MTETNDFETIKFLIETISSIKSSLDSIDKDTSRKAQNIQSISEQLIIIIDALKTFNESNLRQAELSSQKIENLTRAIDGLKAKLDIVELKEEHLAEEVAKVEKATNEINVRTEVSAEALSNIEHYVVDSKDLLLEFKIKNSIKAARKSEEKDKEGFAFSQLVDFVKNLSNVYKLVLSIVVLISLIATIVTKGNVVGLITDVIQSFF